MAVLLKEAWLSDIQENFYQGIEWITNSIDHSSFINNNIIHIPQAGSDPEIVINPTSFPLTISQRDDTDLTYKVDAYVLKPKVITGIETFQIAYDKRMSVMAQNYAYLRQRIGRQTAFNWSTDAPARIIRTTGALTSTVLAPIATGNRRKLTINDLIKASLIMDRDFVPLDERYLLLDSGMYKELLEDPTLTRKDYVDKAVLPTGVIDMLINFKIMTYSFPVIYDGGTNVRKPLNPATGLPVTPASTDNIGCIAWSKYALARALGEIKFSMKEDQPEYAGGDVLGCTVWYGSNPMRTDLKGVVNIVQASA